MGLCACPAKTNCKGPVITDLAGHCIRHILQHQHDGATVMDEYLITVRKYFREHPEEALEFDFE